MYKFTSLMIGLYERILMCLNKSSSPFYLFSNKFIDGQMVKNTRPFLMGTTNTKQTNKHIYVLIHTAKIKFIFHKFIPTFNTLQIPLLFFIKMFYAKCSSNDTKIHLFVPLKIKYSFFCCSLQKFPFQPL